MAINIKPFLVLLLLSVLAGCGSLASGGTQQVTVETPGVQVADCYLSNGNRVKAKSGVPITVMRSENDLIVECYGSNNRKKTVTVESEWNAWSAGNIATGVFPGMVYDYAAKGLYQYPEVITVNFAEVREQGFELPQYHDKDMPNPYTPSIEGYSASVAELPEDGSYQARGVERRKANQEQNPFDGFYGDGNGSEDSAPVPPMTPSKESASSSAPSLKGKTAEELTRSMNPSVFEK